MPSRPLIPRNRSTAELLARVMGLRGSAGIVAARELLGRSGGRLADLEHGTAHGVAGVGAAARDRLAAALELGRRLASPPPEERPRLRGPEDVVRFMAPRLRSLRHEEFHVIILNTRHRVLATARVSQGILDASLVHPREVFAPALEARASAIILVHNHPSGDAEPSPEDRRVTRQMSEAGSVLGIRVLDHVIVGDPGWSTVPPEDP
ncbi:MAG: DNA repair protein RadC [Gemmatimonadales bacterium]|nr:MAG: DNA repair protein RadC [Gemmatimonadales bacterium]